MKGLILCAGKGTRLYPFSEATPKVLLPVANKPILYYCIEQLIKLQIREIGIVIRPEHLALFMKEIGTGEQWNLDITYIHQLQPLGISNAVLQAESFILDEPFILLLGDNLITESLEPLAQAILYDHHEVAIMLGNVANPQDFGIAEIAGNRIVGLEEKPVSPKSNLAVLGAYAFSADIFKAIHAIRPSPRGEYEITDAISWMIDHGYSAVFHKTEQNYSDVGTMERWLEANHWMLDQMDIDGLLNNRKRLDECIIIPPVLIDPTALLRNCIIGPYVTIGPQVKLDGCHMENCILLEGLELFDTGTALSHAILGPQLMYVLTYGGTNK
ncbi:sugar phosphate nucleotidyltransferase [Paenibacillus sp. WQ 127069]|uniref:Glucose-1-phosphate thymidylyltransferase n=1 Tax=Paenibacillus baimaensis TaxID=2982185 RepID=A0ABT2U8A3_9BACL|nr:sugar phosphate nucleotidyltransferase [Paenibacillus sp. WQ 127069]MCU6790865.1 sugar phosphate nucleotidyltransferase [Paenibacillus sp. WQ 127069]